MRIFDCAAEHIKLDGRRHSLRNFNQPVAVTDPGLAFLDAGEERRRLGRR